MIRTTEILAPATASDLTTLATLKDHADITDTGLDAYLARQIRVASSWCVTQTGGRVFGRETVRDTFRNGGLETIMRDVYAVYPREMRPVILSRDRLEPGAVLSVTLSGVVVDPALYSVNEIAGLVYRLTPSGVVSNWSAAVTVTYVSGWVLPGEPDPTLPDVIEDVCLDRATAAYYSRGRDPNVLRERVDSGASDVVYTPTSPDGPSDTRLVPFMVHAA